MKIVKIMITLAVASMTLAATSTTSTASTNGSAHTSSTSSIFSLASLKKSNFSLGYLNETIVGAYKADGFTSDHLFYPGYKIDKYHSVKVVPYLRTYATKAQRSQGDAHTQLLSTSVRLYRSKILTEAKHGVNLNFQLRNYLYPKATRNGGKDSAHRLYFTGSKTVGKINLSGGAFTQINNRNSGDNTALRADYLALGAGYSFNDMWSASTTVEYYHAVDRVGASDKEYISLTLPSVSMNYKSLNLTVGAGFDVIESKDGKTGVAQDWMKKGKIIADLYYSVF